MILGTVADERGVNLDPLPRSICLHECISNENKRLGRRSKAKYFSQEMARRRVVSHGWTEKQARSSSVTIQLVKDATRSAIKKIISSLNDHFIAQWTSVILHQPPQLQLLLQYSFTKISLHCIVSSNSINCLQKTPKFPVANFLEARRIRFNLPKAAQNYFKRVLIHSGYSL